MEIIFYLIPVMLLIRLANKYRADDLALATHYKLRKLDHKLDMLRISGRVPGCEQAIGVLKETTSLDVKQLRKFNVWLILFFSKDEKNDSVVAFEQQLTTSAELHDIQKDIVKVLFQYIVHSNITFSIITRAYRCLVRFIDNFRNNGSDSPITRFKNMVRNSIVSQELAHSRVC